MLLVLTNQQDNYEYIVDNYAMVTWFTQLKKRVECPFWFREEFLPQVEKFKYLEVLFGRREQKIDRQIGAVAAVM